MVKADYSGVLKLPAELDDQLLAQMRESPTLRKLTKEHLPYLRGAELQEMEAGTTLQYPGQMTYGFCVLLEGSLRVSKMEGENEIHFATYKAPETFGETPLLLGMRTARTKCSAKTHCRILRIPEDSFWKLMASSAPIREAVLADCAHRFEMYQAMAVHREKLISLGTLAAGLMHELNNPGAAARRAASQLRENMSRLQQISLRMTRTALSPQQLECVAALQEQILTLARPATLSPLEQADLEEDMSGFLESMEVEHPWQLAPTLVSAGLTHDDIACARAAFPPRILSDVLNYLGTLIGSMQQVSTIEESIARVTDLVVAVKKYAYDDKNRQQQVDVRDSLLSTLTILSHKFRQKGIEVERELPSAETKISCVGAGLAQVWTNLLDNAIDASPENGHIQVRLWTENGQICVAIRDHGHGIPREHWDHIFEPFYTTKEAGSGTGLGLDIAHRIVVGSFHGEIRFTSEESGTEFLVRLPMKDGTAQNTTGCSIAVG